MKIATPAAENEKRIRAPRLGHDFVVRKVPCPNPKYSQIKVYHADSGLGCGGAEYQTMKAAKAAICEDFGMSDKQVAYWLANILTPENIQHCLTPA